jgi:hypothetical protein
LAIEFANDSLLGLLFFGPIFRNSDAITIDGGGGPGIMLEDLPPKISNAIHLDFGRRFCSAKGPQVRRAGPPFEMIVQKTSLGRTERKPALITRNG